MESWESSGEKKTYNHVYALIQVVYTTIMFSFLFAVKFKDAGLQYPYYI